MPDPQSPDEDLDVTLRWPGGSPPEASGGEAAPAPRWSGARPPVRVRPGGSAVAALRDEVDELRARVDALAAELQALRDSR